MAEGGKENKRKEQAMLMTCDEYAAAKSVHRNTVYRWMKSGIVHAVRMAGTHKWLIEATDADWATYKAKEQACQQEHMHAVTR